MQLPLKHNECTLMRKVINNINEPKSSTKTQEASKCLSESESESESEAHM